MREQFAQECMRQKEQVESMETANKVIIVTEVHNPDMYLIKRKWLAIIIIKKNTVLSRERRESGFKVESIFGSFSKTCSLFEEPGDPLLGIETNSSSSSSSSSLEVES